MTLYKLGSLFVLLFVAVTFICCKRTINICGNWHITEYSFNRTYWHDTIELNIENRNSIINSIKKINPNIENPSDSVINLFKDLHFVFNNDSTFKINDEGLILPIIISGSYVGSLKTGKWNMNDQIIDLNISNDHYYFKVLRLDQSKLILGFLRLGDHNPINKITFEKIN